MLFRQPPMKRVRPPSTLPRFAFLTWALAALLGAAEPVLPSTPQPPPASTAAVQPTEGTLPNGLRYTLLPHAREHGRISIRLVVLAGSLDEKDDERGFAHFVEHMAFNGTRHYPAGQLVDFFQSLGLGFGADLWAGTSLTYTIYKIDLPAGRSDRFGEAIEVLRDFSDGIAFGAAEVQREKGVILSEHAARDTNAAQIERQRLAALYRGTLLPARLPGGDPAQIERATPASLRAFYVRCYQPDRLRIVITGDIDPATAQAVIARHFTSLARPAVPTPRVLPTVPPLAPLQTDVVPNAIEGGGAVSLMVVEAVGKLSPESLAQGYTRALALRALDRRLVERRAADLTRFGSAHTDYGAGADGHLTHFLLAASTAQNQWESGVALLESELRRARDLGFSPTELSEQATAVLAAARAQRQAFAGYLPDAVADSIASSLAADQTWIHPEETLRVAEASLPKITAGAAQEALRKIFADEKLHLMLIRGTPPAGGREALFEAYRASAERPLPPKLSASDAAIAFRYENFGIAGSVRQRIVEKDLGLELVRFANGVQLNLRASSTEPKRFRLAARLGRGLADSPRDQPGLPHLAAHFFGVCDVGQHTLSELNRILESHAVSAYSTSESNALLIEMQGPVSELPFALRLLTARIVDVRLDRSRLFSGLSAYAGCRSSHLDNSARLARTEASIQMAEGDPRLRDATMDEAGRYTFTELSQWMRTRWLEGPLEVALTGEIDPALITTAAAETLGTLAPRRRPAPAPGEQLTLPTKPSHETRREPLPDQSAAVQLSWSAAGFDDLRRRRALALALDVLLDRVQKTLRQELGATYSPEARLVRHAKQRAFGYATMALTFDPSRVEDFTRRAIAIADTLATGGVTPEEFTRLREPQLASAAEALRSNEWWLDEILAFAQSEPSVLQEARTLGTALAQITLAEVNLVAADFFSSRRASAFVVIPVAPSPDRPPDVANPVWSIIQRAEAKFGAADLAGALADVSEAIALAPKNAELYAFRARIKSAQGDLTAALADCDLAVNLDSTNANTYNTRAALKMSNRDLAGASADCTRAIELDPAFAFPHVNRSIIRLAQNDGVGSVAAATVAIELESKNAMAHAIRGAARLVLGHTDLARPDLDRAIELDPRVSDAHRNRGLIRLGKRDFTGALADFTRALELNALDLGAYINRGIVKGSLGDHDAAILDYNQALELSPHNAELFNNRGYARQNKGDLDAAIADYTRALELNPKLALAYNNRGHARKTRGDNAGAAEDFAEASRIAMLANVKFAVPNLTSPLPLFGSAPPSAASPSFLESGNLKRSQKDWAGAIADYTKALEANPDDAEAYYGRGLARKLSRDDTGAMADLTKTVELNPKADNAYLERGHLFRARGDFNRALADFAKVIELQPKSALAYYHRGLAYEGLQKASLALPDLDMAVTLSPKFYQALSSRAYTRQARGDYDGAMSDANEAITLAADYAPSYYYRGLVRHITADLAGALEDYDTLLRLNPGYFGGRLARGHVRYAQGDFTGALEDYERAAPVPGMRHPVIHRGLTELRLHHPGARDKLARDIESWPSGWTKTVGLLLTGQLSVEKFLVVAADEVGRSARSTTCETRFFAGMACLLNDQTEQARAHFETGVATNLRNYNTYLLARAELARLNATRPKP